MTTLQTANALLSQLDALVTATTDLLYRNGRFRSPSPAEQAQIDSNRVQVDLLWDQIDALGYAIVFGAHANRLVPKDKITAHDFVIPRSWKEVADNALKTPKDS